MRYTLNFGLADRFIRTLIAIVIASIGGYYESWWGLLAIIPLAQALAGWCPTLQIIQRKHIQRIAWPTIQVLK